jgi:hypothetical protein
MLRIVVPVDRQRGPEYDVKRLEGIRTLEVDSLRVLFLLHDTVCDLQA